MKSVYAVAAYYNRAYGVTRIPACWKFTAALNFYREASGHNDIAEFVNASQYPTDQEVYIPEDDFDSAFLKRQGLKVVYHARHGGSAMVAIRPDLERASTETTPSHIRSDDYKRRWGMKFGD